MTPHTPPTARGGAAALAVYGSMLRTQVREVMLWGTSLVALVLAVTALWPSMRDSGALDDIEGSLPSGTAEALGLLDFASPAGYLKGNLYAVLLPLVLCWFAVALVTSATAGDEDAGRLELLLVLPVSRRSAFLARALASVTNLVLVGLVTWASLIGCCLLFDLDVSTAHLSAASLMVTLLAVLHAAVAFAAGGWGLRRGAVMGVSSTVMLMGYVIQAFLPLSDSLDAWAAVSPWQWALGADPLNGGVDAAGAAALAGLSLLLLAVGTYVVARRDVRSA